MSLLGLLRALDAPEQPLAPLAAHQKQTQDGEKGETDDEKAHEQPMAHLQAPDEAGEPASRSLAPYRHLYPKDSSAISAL